MFDHVVISVSNYEHANEFFLQALAPLGVRLISEGPLGVELAGDSAASLCLRRTDATTAPPLHLAFTAKTRRHVHEFHQAALAVGGTDHGAPGLRPQYHASYYAAFVLGPDGHNIEAVCHAVDDAAG